MESFDKESFVDNMAAHAQFKVARDLPDSVYNHEYWHVSLVEHLSDCGAASYAARQTLLFVSEQVPLPESFLGTSRRSQFFAHTLQDARREFVDGVDVASYTVSKDPSQFRNSWRSAVERTFYQRPFGPTAVVDYQALSPARMRNDIARLVHLEAASPWGVVVLMDSDFPYVGAKVRDVALEHRVPFYAPFHKRELVEHAIREGYLDPESQSLA